MLLGNDSFKLINIENNTVDYQLRFTNSFDQRAGQFEEMVQKQPPKISTVIDDDGMCREMSWPKLSFWQSSLYFLRNDFSFYLLQVKNIRTEYCYQVVIKVERSKISLFNFGVIEKWSVDVSDNSLDLEFITGQLQTLIKNHTSLVSLRIQPYSPGAQSLKTIYQLLKEIGFEDTTATAYQKTRLIDLRPSVDEMLATYSSNGRSKLKLRDKARDSAVIKDLRDESIVPALKKALDDSFLRSQGGSCAINFSPLIQNTHPTDPKVCMLGFFLTETPEIPKAFITGVNHGSVVEFSVGGSVSEANLRQYPFNHILMWQLALRSKAAGAQYLDMGGITNGDVTDPLKGISAFKRMFNGFEMTTGREMLWVVKPIYLSFYQKIQKSLKFL